MCKWTSKDGSYHCIRKEYDESGYCLFHKPNKNEKESELFWKIINFNIFSKKLNQLTKQLYLSGSTAGLLIEMEHELNKIYNSNFSIQEKARPDFDKYKENIIGLYNESKISGNNNRAPDFNGFVFPDTDLGKYKFNYQYNPNTPFVFGVLSFKEVVFEGFIDFSGFNFITDTSFISCNFTRGVIFAKAKFYGDCKFIDTIINTGFGIMGTSIFQNTEFNGSKLILENVKGLLKFDCIFSDITEFVLKNMHYPKDSGRASYGENAYRIAKIRATLFGRYSEASEYFILERIYKRKQLIPGWHLRFLNKDAKGFKKIMIFNCFKDNIKTTFKFRKKIFPCFFDWLMYEFSGYGEQPYRVIVASLSTILLFALGNILIERISIIDSLFYSFITFTTLGLKAPYTGDLSLYLKVALAAESFLGGIFIALFVLTLSKKYGRG